MDKKETLKKLAKLIVEVGVNLQKDQRVVINIPVGLVDFARELSKAAYQLGAKEVCVNYRDDVLKRDGYEYQTITELTDIKQFEIDKFDYYVDQGACFISVSASDPDAFKGIDSVKLQEANRAYGLAMKKFREATMNNSNRWCVTSYPTLAWAKKVFPALTDDEAMESLFELIAKSLLLDKEDPVKEWEEHNKAMDRRIDIMNEKKFETLHFTSSNGTDLKVGLMKESVFSGASEKAKDGIEFVANLPTEEIFSAPHRLKTNGIVHSTKPLSYNGNIIDNFYLKFEDGKVVDFGAEKGGDTLKSIITNDETSCFLGEVALIPYHSPISLMDTIFFNTLFDENASCHLALGRAYPTCVENSDDPIEKLVEQGLNDSITHVDFMIGAKDTKIVGTTFDGEEFVVFENGDFAF